MNGATAIAQNRLAKALRLATTLRQAGCTPYRLTQLREEHWVLAALASQVSIPSNETRVLVVQLMAARKTRRGKAI